ncbi:hypothetical protein Tco_0105795 [Tanacetum coccineum]
MAYHDKYKKVLDEIWKDEVELDGMIVKEEEEAIKKVKGKALKREMTPEHLYFLTDLRERSTKMHWPTMGGNDAEAGSSRSKHSRQYETVEEVLLPQVHHEFLLWEGYNNKAKEIDDMLRIKLREAESNEEIFTFVAWIRAFNIKEPIYSGLCHEFYSTYEFDEVCADDELQTKKIIKFRHGGRAYNLTLLEFARRLGLHHADELEEDGFDVSPTLTPFGDSDFLLEEVDAFLALEDDPTLPEGNDSYYDPKGDILLLESFLNDDPSLPPPT